LFKFYANTRPFLHQLHHLLWLADFLLPKCCHIFIIAKPGNLATHFGNITQLTYVFDGKDIKYRSVFIYAKKPLQNKVFKRTKA